MNLSTYAEYADIDSRAVIGLSWGLDQKWYETNTDKPDRSSDRMAEEMILNFSDSSHPIFRASSAFERGEVRSKGGRKKSLHFNGSDENIESLLRTAISANQFSVYGAMADLCHELSKYLRAPGKPAAIDHLETMETPTLLLKKLRPMQSNGEIWCKKTSENSSNCEKTRNYLNCVLMRV